MESTAAESEEVLFSGRAGGEHLRLARSHGHITLFRDGLLAAHSHDEHRLHEALVHVPMTHRLLGRVRRVLIIGGGDGLALRRILEWREVRSVTLCGANPELVELASKPPLAELNRRSLSDGRVTVSELIVDVLLRDAEQPWDLILLSTPAPRRPRQARLFERRFLERLTTGLATGGILTLQVPWLPQTFATVFRELREVLDNVYPYRAFVQTRLGMGFLMGSRRRLDVRRRPPEEARYLSPEILPLLFELPPDERHYLGRSDHAGVLEAHRADLASRSAAKLRVRPSGSRGRSPLRRGRRSQAQLGRPPSRRHRSTGRGQ